MKRIIAKKVLREFWHKHPDAEQYLKTWYETAKLSHWFSPMDIKKLYSLIIQGNGLLSDSLEHIQNMIK